MAKKEFTVTYERTVVAEYDITVSAESEEQARQMVESGDYDSDESVKNDQWGQGGSVVTKVSETE